MKKLSNGSFLYTRTELALLISHYKNLLNKQKETDASTEEKIKTMFYMQKYQQRLDKLIKLKLNAEYELSDKKNYTKIVNKKEKVNKQKTEEIEI